MRVGTGVSTNRVSGWDQETCLALSRLLIPSAHADGTDSGTSADASDLWRTLIDEQ